MRRRSILAHQRCQNLTILSVIPLRMIFAIVVAICQFDHWCGGKPAPPRPHQAAAGSEMRADAAGERCGDAGELEIELCVRDSGLGGLDRRLCTALVNEALIEAIERRRQRTAEMKELRRLIQFLRWECGAWCPPSDRRGSWSRWRRPATLNQSLT